MVNTRFASESREIDLQNKKYTRGERGVAEMCNLHCRVRGRGHVHLIECSEGAEGGCLEGVHAGARHETQQYGPDLNVPNDELSHSAFWAHLGFKDPFIEREQREFAHCGHFCPSAGEPAHCGSQPRTSGGVRQL